MDERGVIPFKQLLGIDKIGIIVCAINFQRKKLDIVEAIEF